MQRRQFLRASAVVGAAALSGCTTERLQEAERDPPAFEPVDEEDVDLPVRQRLAVAEAAIERAASEPVEDPDEFASRLEEHGVRVEHLASERSDGEPILSLEYVATDEGETMRHVGTVAGAYAGLVASTDEHERLDATLVDPESEPFGEYEVRRHWAEAYNDGTYTARNYAKEIAVTIAST